MARNPVPRACAVWLQRSHTFEGVEGSAICSLSLSMACFNGATPLRVWKVATCLSDRENHLLLQRSHTFEGVEGAVSPG